MIQLISPAKINLALDVLSKDPSGYHKVQTVLHEVSDLHDLVTVKESDENDSLLVTSQTLKLPNIEPEINPAFKALQLIKSKHNISKNFEISIEQNIPFRSGLGGSSSNAAAVLKAINELCDLDLSVEELQKIAEKIGMDVPFFIEGGTALAENYGEKITQLPRLEALQLEVFIESSSQPSKTQSQYESLDLSMCSQKTDQTKKLVQALQNGNTDIGNLFHNDFEQLHKLPKNAHLAGAGPSFFKTLPFPVKLDLE